MPDITPNSATVDRGSLLTVAELADKIDASRPGLGRVGSVVEELATWCSELPRRHVPVPHETLVSEFMTTESADPTTLEREVQELLTLIEQTARAASRVRETALSGTGLFAFPAGRDAQAEESDPYGRSTPADVPAGCVRVVAVPPDAYLSEKTFESQRKLLRRALSFVGPRSGWSGILPRHVNENTDRWQALVTAADEGVDVRIEP